MEIQIKTCELTKSIVKQLDFAREKEFNNPTVKPFCRVETPSDLFVILETVNKEEKKYTKITYSTYWNTGISRYCQEKLGIKDIYDIPKVILLK